MTRITRYINRLLLLPAILFFSACQGLIEHYDPPVCDYSVQLRYDYNEENTSGGVNMIEYYVYTIDEYIFDEDGILYEQRRIKPERCREMMNSEWDLPPGRYSVIAIGNQDERSITKDGDSLTKTPEKGVTHRDEMMLILRNCESLPEDTKGPSEKLYHGYKTFTVNPTGISRVRVDMINAHMRLKFRITWKNSTTPSRADSYYAVLESVPSEYRLMPEYIYPKGVAECKKFISEVHDEYPGNCNSVIHHIPHTCYKPAGAPDAHNILRHRYDTYINGDNQMWGYFTTYRIQRSTRPILKIFQSNGTQIVKSIPLQDFLDWWGYESPTTTLKQEYELNIVVNADGSLSIVPLDIADWEEGGLIQ